MKKRHIPGVIDVYEVVDPQEIEAINGTAAIDRRFDTKTCPFNRFLLERSLRVLSFRGKRFPTMEPRDSGARQSAQNELWDRLNLEVPGVRKGPAELEPLARWVRGDGNEEILGLESQKILGRLFSADFESTPQSWAAALTLVQAPRISNPAKLLWWSLSGRVRRAKRQLADMVHGDLSAVNAIGIAVHNLAKSLRKMRALYSDTGIRASVSPADAVKRCLAAPRSLYRQATAAGEVNGSVFSKNCLFILEIGEAANRDETGDLIFMRGSWSSCPAERWVPAMLEGVWARAISMETSKSPYPQTGENAEERE